MDPGGKLPGPSSFGEWFGASSIRVEPANDIQAIMAI
jgi:hypothetical protein